LAGDERARVIEKAPEIAAYVARHAGPGDIVLVMSNGAFDGVHDKILQALAS
jgi:UDP-N-acetylmuramate-alanine ligase